MFQSVPRRSSNQHKPKRDTKKAKELADIRRENNLLKRKLARAERNAEKVLYTQPENTDFTPMDEQPQPDSKPGCAACNSVNTKTLVLPTGTVFTACADCGHRIREVCQTEEGSR